MEVYIWIIWFVLWVLMLRCDTDVGRGYQEYWTYLSRFSRWRQKKDVPDGMLRSASACVESRFAHWGMDYYVGSIFSSSFALVATSQCYVGSTSNSLDLKKTYLVVLRQVTHEWEWFITSMFDREPRKDTVLKLCRGIWPNANCEGCRPKEHKPPPPAFEYVGWCKGWNAKM